MMCDGSGELRWGWSCPGCLNCNPAPRHTPPSRPVSDEQARTIRTRIAATDPWRQ